MSSLRRPLLPGLASLFFHRGVLPSSTRPYSQHLLSSNERRKVRSRAPSTSGPNRFPSPDVAARLSSLDSHTAEGPGPIQVGDRHFSPIHLRDHCRCPKCFHSVTHQRLLDTFRLPRDLHATSIVEEADGLRTTWSDDAHESFYPYSFLQSLLPADAPTTPSRVPLGKTPWRASTSPSNLPRLQASSLPASLLEALEALDEHGVVFIDGVEPTTKATEAVSRLFGGGKLRNTHYGDFWDFTADMKHGDLAYSNEPLRAHTDTTYFHSPCSLQIFHLLHHPPPGQGGHTLLVDGLSCATQLSPSSFKTLSTVRTRAHAAGTPGHLFITTRGHPVFELDGEGKVDGVRWNSEDRSLMPGRSAAEVERWYEAGREWEELLRREENEKWVKLQPGTVVVIDNERVMHGRSSFTGERRMCGAYIGKEEWRSLLTVLRNERAGDTPRSVWDLGY